MTQRFNEIHPIKATSSGVVSHLYYHKGVQRTLKLENYNRKEI